jgi:hypothetical protein
MKDKENKLMKKKHVEERKKAYALLLALPPLIALAMIGMVSFTNKTPILAPEGLMMSPVQDSSPLIISLTIFIIGYFIFIGFLFKDDIRHAWYNKILHKKD